MTVVSAETDLFTGLATLLDTAGIGTYAATGIYAADQVGIVLGSLPQSPSEAIALTPYSVSDSADLSDSIIGVQVMLRGTEDPTSVLDRSAAIFDQFQRLERQTFGGLFVAVMWRQTGRLDGKDDSNRWLSAESYYCRVNWPTRYRTD